MSASPSETSTATSETAAPAQLTARDPATGATLGVVAVTPPECVEQVVEAVAKVQPLWALLRVKDRARYMDRMAQAVIDDLPNWEGLAGGVRNDVVSASGWSLDPMCARSPVGE